jgi:N-carbamoyl-L-amino-acid hydrolase
LIVQRRIGDRKQLKEHPMQVDTDRFVQDLQTLRAIGSYRTGVHRPTYSPQDMESRRWLCDRLGEVGLDVTLDGIGNVFGRNRCGGPHLLVGSHIETQNHAGWLDGALGVIAALALARAGFPVDVCAYADEEGHWGDFMGSRSLIGDLTEAQIDQARNRHDGRSLRGALEAAGLAQLRRLRLEEDRYRGALELHIEQGTQLENKGLQVGVVTGIVAVQHWRIVVEGRQDHTGGTTMSERRDAGLTAIRLLAAIDQEFPRVCGDRSVWTTGKIVLEPNAPAIIPGRAEIDFSFRDISSDVMEQLQSCLRRLIWESNRRERCPVRMELVNKLEPTPCDQTIRSAFASAAESLYPGHWQEMPSGAIHDSQILGRKMPVGMLFVPSINGISHHWTEDTKVEDLIAGMKVFADGANRILSGG